MRIMIFSGATEGRLLSRTLAERGAEVTVSVATEYGGEAQGTIPGVQTLTGRMPVEEMARILRGMDLCVDATHPYAVRVSASIRRACEESGVTCLRLLREESKLPEAALVFDSAGEAAAYLGEQDGNILLTTGAKELDAWGALSKERLFPRVLPMEESLRACERLGIPRRNICAMQGPFSQALNEALLRQFSIRWLVTKDGGAPGGFPEKAAAAAATGTRLVVLRRPMETGERYEDVLRQCLERMEE